MAILPIVTYNDPILRQTSTPVEGLSKEIEELIENMFETMYNSSGVGLAAPQIGKSLQLFVIDTDVMTEDSEDEEDYGPMVFINPEIIEKRGEDVVMEEGCLSIPDVRDDVMRMSELVVRFRDKDFQERTETFNGWVSRVIQHEVDHLNGVLFLDYLSSFRRRFHRYTLRKIDTGKLKTEYPIAPKKPVQTG